MFVSAVYPDCKDDACNKQRDEELKKSKVKAKVFHAIVLSALERVHGIQTQPFVCDSARRNCRAGVSPADLDIAAEPAAPQEDAVPRTSRRAITTCRHSL